MWNRKNLAETTYGKVVSVGVSGLKRSPTFAVIDTRNLNISFYDFDAREVEKKIKEESLPEEIVKILHHGI